MRGSAAFAAWLFVLAFHAAPARAQADAGPQADAAARARAGYAEFLETTAAGDPRRAEAQRRLADLELEQGEALSLEGAGATARMHLERAASAYRQILEEERHGQNRDRIWYQLARALDLAGFTGPSLAALDALIVSHPDSSLVAEALFRRGEGAFSAGDYETAAERYAAVATRETRGDFYRQALYKLGWSRFRQSDYTAALDAFFDLLDLELSATATATATAPVSTLASTPGAAPLAALGRAQRELVDDSLRAVCIAFSHLGGVAAAASFLDASETLSWQSLVFRRLGDLYLEQKRFHDAAAAYRRFVERQPLADDAPALQLAVIETWRQARYPEKALDSTRRFAEDYAFDTPYWDGRDRDRFPALTVALDRSLGELAQYHHLRAQEGGGRAEFDLAAHWYGRWLADFPDDAAAPEKRFLLAEILFSTGRFSAAMLEYEHSAYLYGSHARAPEAGYAALLAAAQHAGTLAPEARADWERVAVNSSLRFAAAFPEHEEALPVLTHAAEALFALGDLPAALAAAGRVIARVPDVPVGLRVTSWTVIAHARFDQGDFAKAEAAYVQVLGLLLADSPPRAALEERLAAAIYRQAEEALALAETERAVGHFLRVATAAPGAAIRANAEYDAATALLAVHDWPRAARVLEAFRHDHPDHALLDDVPIKLALAYSESGETALAAAEFEGILGDRARAAAARKEAGARAAVLYVAQGDTAAAARVYETIWREIPQTLEERLVTLEHLAALADDSGDAARTREWRERIVAEDAGAGDARSLRSRSVAGRAALALADETRLAYAALALTVPLAESLRRKRGAMERMLEAYARVTDYGIGEIATAATFYSADAYVQLARALLASERPADLDSETLEQYSILLEEQAFPFEEKAIEIHKINTSRAAEGLFDTWVAASYAQLAELVPARYARTERGADLVLALD